jgi:hypothetical protein
MIETIQFKRGLEANLPRLADGEPAFCEDTQNVYIGSSSGNKLVFSGSLTDYLNKLGDLTQLQTTDKDTLVHAINDNVASLAEKSQQYYVDVMNPPSGYVKPVADGVTNDSTAINNIIAYCVANKRDLYIPAGTYKANLQVAVPTGSTNGQLFIKIFGDGESTKIINSSGTILSMNGLDSMVSGAIVNLRNVTVKDIYLDGSSSNATGINLQKVQNIKLQNIFINNCKGNAILFNGAMDVKISNLDTLGCGRANTTSDYAYALHFQDCNTGDFTQVSNAIHFSNTRVELSPCIIYSGGGTYGVYFNGCKLEKGSVNTLATPYRPLYFNVATEFGFSECHLVNNHWQSGTTENVEDNGLPFIYSADNALGDQQTRQINFSNCNFACSPYLYSMWYNGSNTHFSDCSFGGTCGNVSLYASPSNVYPFVLNNRNTLQNCVVMMRKDMQFMAINGAFNKVNVLLDNVDNSWTISIFGYASTTNNNTIEYDLIGSSDPPETYSRIYVNATTVNGSGINNIGQNTMFTDRTLHTTTNGDISNTAFERFISTSATSVVWVRYNYNGYILTIISTVANCNVSSSTGNLKTKDGNDRVLNANNTISFIFINGIGYEI